MFEHVFQAIEHFTTHGYAWISKDLYFTYHLKLRKAIYGPESVANQQQNIEIAEVTRSYNVACGGSMLFSLIAYRKIGKLIQTDTWHVTHVRRGQEKW